MKIKLISCMSSKNEIEWLKTLDQYEFDCDFLDYSFHANPDKIHAKMQQIINDSQHYDLIILTHGRCSNSLIGLSSPKVPIIFPNTHDCIGLLLGSNKRHQKTLNENPGTYFFTQGWLDYGRTPYDEYIEYLQKYGKDNAQFLIKSLYGQYTKAMFIITPGIDNIEKYRAKLKVITDFFGWHVDEINGDITLLASILKRNIISDINYIQPGKKITEDHFVMRGV